MTTTTKKKRQIIVAGDFLLKARKGPKCQTDPLLSGICCLPGAPVKDITRKLPSHVQALRILATWVVMKVQHLVQVQSKDFRALGQLARESRAQVIFSSILPAALEVAVILEENDGLILLIYGSMTYATARILRFSILGWSAWHQACWRHMGFIFLIGGRGSLLMNYWV